MTSITEELLNDLQKRVRKAVRRARLDWGMQVDSDSDSGESDESDDIQELMIILWSKLKDGRLEYVNDSLAYTHAIERRARLYAKRAREPVFQELVDTHAHVPDSRDDIGDKAHLLLSAMGEQVSGAPGITFRLFVRNGWFIEDDALDVRVASLLGIARETVARYRLRAIEEIKNALFGEPASITSEVKNAQGGNRRRRGRPREDVSESLKRVFTRIEPMRGELYALQAAGRQHIGKLMPFLDPYKDMAVVSRGIGDTKHLLEVLGELFSLAHCCDEPRLATDALREMMAHIEPVSDIAENERLRLICRRGMRRARQGGVGDDDIRHPILMQVLRGIDRAPRYMQM